MELKFVSRSDIHKRVARCVRIGVKVEAEIHILACSILMHTRDHGDYTAGEALLNGLPRGTRVKALAFWFKHFSNGKLTFKVNDENKYVGKLDKDRDEGDFKLDDAVGMTFADLTNEKAPTSVTVQSLLSGIKSKATNAELNDDGSPKVTPEARDVASKILAFVRDNKLNVAA